MGTKESKVTGRNSRDWKKKKKKETKLKYFQLAQIVKTPLCGTTWWGAQHAMIIVKQGKIIIYNHSCVIWIDNNDNLHPSSYQKLWHNPQNVLAAYGANPMSFFLYMLPDTSLALARYLWAESRWSSQSDEVIKEVAFAVVSFLFFPLAGFVYTIFLSSHKCSSLSGRAFDM